MKKLIQFISVFSLWIAVIKAFLSSGLRQQQRQQFSLSVKRKDASAKWDDDDDWKAEDIEVHIPQSLLANFEEDVGKFVTVCAIKTYKGYLKNFNDEISQVKPLHINVLSSLFNYPQFVIPFIPSSLSYQYVIINPLYYAFTEMDNSFW